MEAWFIADYKTLQIFFGQGFSTKALPSNTAQIESIAKENIYQFLATATKSCKNKAKYGKGEHAFKLLAKIDPTKVTQASPWVKRFANALQRT
jgi:cellobiose phosphorylase